MQRRDLVAFGLAAALATPALAQSRAATLRFVPITDLPSIDPILTTNDISRTHGYLVFDTLFGLDDQARPQPQMVDAADVSDDGRRVTLRLRDGLRFHDGEPVRARDAVASIRRWGARDALGQTLLALTEEVSAPDDRSIVFRLRRPFPRLFHALAKTSPPVCFVMPERLALTDPARPIPEAIGSGPFRYLPNERVSGARVAYARFEGYVPRRGRRGTGTAGPKRVHFDRVEWHVLPDPATAAAALQAGEVDWWELPTPDLVPLLRRNPGIRVETADPMGFMGALRLNHLHPPFDDPDARRALLPAILQHDFMTAVASTAPGSWRDGVGFFPLGTPMAAPDGLEALAGPRSLPEARARLAAAGHGGARVTLIGPTDDPNMQAMTEVGADLFRRLGLGLDYVPSDWATVVQRRANREAPARGGWNALVTFFSGADFLDPGVHLLLRGNGTAAWPGWPSSERIEALRADWLAETDPAASRRLAARIQVQAFQELPYIPLGQFVQPTAYSRGITDVIEGPTVFWNIRPMG